MPSRAVDSQQMLVSVPVITRFSTPKPSSTASRFDDPWIKALKRVFWTIVSSARTSSSATMAWPWLPSVNPPLWAARLSSVKKYS